MTKLLGLRMLGSCWRSELRTTAYDHAAFDTPQGIGVERVPADDGRCGLKKVLSSRIMKGGQS